MNHDLQIPTDHVVIPSNYLTALKNDREALKQLRASTGKLVRFQKNASDELKAYLAVALASAPSLSITAAEYAAPMFVTAFLVHHGLEDNLGKEENYPSSFPSGSYLCSIMEEIAAENMVWQSHELFEKKVHLSCDKGSYH